jgi:glutamyl-tRNA(Gln) amidotransferase subunit E
MPGAARMYPETDVPPIPITDEMLSEIRANLPETWDRRIKRIAESYKISEELSRQLVQSGEDELFERLSKKSSPRLVSSVILSTMKEMEREGFDTSVISEKHLADLLTMVEKKHVAKEAIPDILRKVAKSPEKEVGALVGAVKSVGAQDLEKTIERIIKSKKDLLAHPRREKVLMGLVMKEVRGSVDGKTVMDTLVRVLKKH